MIEYIPALDPVEYRVRRLLLRSGRVVPIGRLKSAAPDQMQGTGRNQVYAPDGSELYTLYTQQHNGGHKHSIGGPHAFIHLLNLQDSWAHCIDLPHSFGHGEATASAIALSPSGRYLYVADWTSGAVAKVEPGQIEVTAEALTDFGSPDEQTWAQATEDRLYVAGNSSIVVIESGTLEEIDRWSLDGEITGLRLSPNDKRLYAVVNDGIVALDASDGSILGSFPALDVDGIEFVGTAEESKPGRSF
jgi:hypothetical protein